MRIKNQFGTFGGVFTPSILTILGVIMFMRAPFVVGQAGALNALIILLLAKSITLLTSLSLSAIATNIEVKGGGAYYIISRVLGPEFGGVIGIAFFLAQAVAAPFYILGFAEAVVRSFEFLEGYFQLITLSSAALLFVIAYIGAGWAIKIQYLIMAILFSSIVAFLGGAINLFCIERFYENMSPAYTLVTTTNSDSFSFWIIFAIFFPAVTGAEAGVNMSGDLKNSSKSIPKGAISAIIFGAIIYGLQIILSAGAYERSMMIETPYQVLRDNALFNLTPLVAAGVFAATLSSALGSFMGAPRILQAVSRDNIISAIKPFAVGTIKGDEPRRALIFTGIIGFGILIWAGNEAGGESLNAVAAIISMFFLFTYGMVNASAFIEAYSENPSFRPKFKFFHWTTALIGLFSCIIAAVLIDFVAATIALTILLLMFWYIRTKHLQVSFGDARRGFIYSSLRQNLIKLNNMPEDDRNWRPTILVFSGNPTARLELVKLANWLQARRGIVFLANILLGDVVELAPRRETAIKQLKNIPKEIGMSAFPIVTICDSVENGISNILQTTSIGSIYPNLVVLGWSYNAEDMCKLYSSLAKAIAIGKSIVLARHHDVIANSAGKRIDIWWRGMNNGSLMLMLAHLMKFNHEWSNSSIRLLRIINKSEGYEPALKDLNQVIKSTRVHAEAEVIVSEKNFCELLKESSHDAGLIFLGFELPEKSEVNQWYSNYENILNDLPPTVLIKSSKPLDIS